MTKKQAETHQPRQHQQQQQQQKEEEETKKLPGFFVLNFSTQTLTIIIF